MKRMFLVIIVLMFAVSANAEVTIDYEISKDLKVWYEGNRPHGVKFNAQFIFNGLKVADRRALHLPLTYHNPDFDPEQEISPDNLQDIAYTDKDSKEVESFSQSVSYFADVNKVKSIIIGRCEKRLAQLNNKLVQEDDQALSVSTDSKFKSSLTEKEAL